MSWLTPDLIDILLSILKAIVILLVVVTCGAFMSFGERRLLGLFQNRYGPNRVGWGGSLQLVADMIKMFFKEDWIPRFSDRVIFTLAPMIAFTSLLLAFAIVPVSPTWVVADLNIGILYVFAMVSIAYLWCRAVIVAKDKIAKGSDDPFYQAKIHTARFYMQKLVPQTSALFSTIMAGAAPVMAMDEKLFEVA